MKIDELSLKTPDELKELTLQLRRELMNLRFQRSTNQLTSTAQFRQVRRQIARLKTIVHQRSSKSN